MHQAPETDTLSAVFRGLVYLHGGLVNPCADLDYPYVGLVNPCVGLVNPCVGLVNSRAGLAGFFLSYLLTSSTPSIEEM